MKALNRIALSAVLAVGLLIGGCAPAVIAPAQPQPTPPTTVLPAGPQPLGVVIRLYDTGPAFHLDADHWESGIDTSIPPAIDAGGFLTFYTKEKNAVIAADCAPDETLVARGITTGISNGSHLIRVRFVKPDINTAQPVVLDLNDSVHYSRVSGAYSNIWCHITHDGAWTPPE